MTEIEKAARAALEALEETRNALAWFYDSYPEDVTPKGNELLPNVETVLAALRRALEQPAQQEIEELTAQRDKLADILTRTANALKGEPAELSAHSWHDLPEVAQQLKTAQQEPDKYLLEVECTKCGATEQGVLTFTRPQAREPEQPAQGESK